MPVYEYECSACGRRFEAMQKFSDPALSDCRNCGATGVRKVLAPAAFVLKGSGWYVTDYASPDRRKAAEAEAPKKESAETAASAPAGCASGACAGACGAKA